MTNPLLTPPRRRTEYLYSGEAEAKLDEYEDRIEQAFAEEGSDVRKRKVSDRIAKERDDFKAEQMAAAPKLVFEAITHRRLQRLYDEHPPRKGDKGDEMVGYNRETFAPALVRASLVEPAVTDEQWDEFVESVSAGRMMRLHEVANDLAGGDVDLPKSSAVTTLTLARGRAQRPHDGTA